MIMLTPAKEVRKLIQTDIRKALKGATFTTKKTRQRFQELENQRLEETKRQTNYLSTSKCINLNSNMCF